MHQTVVRELDRPTNHQTRQLKRKGSSQVDRRTKRQSFNEPHSRQTNQLITKRCSQTNRINYQAMQSDKQTGMQVDRQIGRQHKQREVIALDIEQQRHESPTLTVIWHACLADRRQADGQTERQAYRQAGRLDRQTGRLAIGRQPESKAGRLTGRQIE